MPNIPRRSLAAAGLAGSPVTALRRSGWPTSVRRPAAAVGSASAEQDPLAKRTRSRSIREKGASISYVDMDNDNQDAQSSATPSVELYRLRRLIRWMKMHPSDHRRSRRGCLPQPQDAARLEDKLQRQRARVDVGRGAAEQPEQGPIIAGQQAVAAASYLVQQRADPAGTGPLPWAARRQGF
jgi:hypothetical protein